jgi:hypothetical protein
VEVIPRSLRFYSRGIGVPDTAAALLRSAGGDTVHVRDFQLSDVRFTTDRDSLTLAPGQDHLLRVVYTPGAGPAASATMSLLSDDGSELAPAVELAAAATPINTANARLSLVRLDAIAYPQVGDTVRVRLDLQPGGDPVDGLEVYLAYDPERLEPAAPDAPVTGPEQGLSAAGAANRILAATQGEAAVHYSLLLSGTATEDRELGVLGLVVRAPMASGTQLRVVNEPPERNSNYFTPALVTRSLPGGNRVLLGNGSPSLRPFPLLRGEEDRSANIALAGMVYDAETPLSDLVWAFDTGDEALTARVDVLSDELGPVARFVPEPDQFGVFGVTATVSDPGGAADTAYVVVDIAQANDPPSGPVYELPADGAADLSPPILFRWSAVDPDPFDRLSYALEMGLAADQLNPVAADLADPAYELPGIVPGTVYYWRVVVTDREGAFAEGAVRSFTSAPDTDPPSLELEPTVTAVGQTTVSLTWRTDELTKNRVRYGPSATFQDSVGVLEQAVEGQLRLFNVALTGLQPGTVYAFEVVFADVAGNLNRSATTTFQTEAGSQQPAVGDLNGDLAVTFEDFIRFANAYNTQSGDAGYLPTADLDGSGRIDFTDFLAFASVYGTDYGSP